MNRKIAIAILKSIEWKNNDDRFDLIFCELVYISIKYKVTSVNDQSNQCVVNFEKYRFLSKSLLGFFMSNRNHVKSKKTLGPIIWDLIKKVGHLRSIFFSLHSQKKNRTELLINRLPMDRLLKLVNRSSYFYYFFFFALVLTWFFAVL